METQENNMKTQLLKKDELDTIKQIKTNNRLILEEFGSIQLAKIDLDLRLDAAKNILETIKEDERKFTADLEKKYGKGTINIETGEFVAA